MTKISCFKHNIFFFRLNSKWDLRRLCKTVGAVALPKMVGWLLFYHKQIVELYLNQPEADVWCVPLLDGANSWWDGSLWQRLSNRGGRHTGGGLQTWWVSFCFIYRLTPDFSFKRLQYLTNDLVMLLNRERRWRHFNSGHQRLHWQPDGWYWEGCGWWCQHLQGSGQGM